MSTGVPVKSNDSDDNVRHYFTFYDHNIFLLTFTLITKNDVIHADITKPYNKPLTYTFCTVCYRHVCNLFFITNHCDLI